MATEFRLPEVGENIEQAKVVHLLVAVGDTLEQNQTIMEIETDKATLEVPSEVEGMIIALNVSEGGTVDVGSVVLTVDGDGSDPAVAAAVDDLRPATPIAAGSPRVPAASPPVYSAPVPPMTPAQLPFFPVALPTPAPVLIPQPAEPGRCAPASPSVRRLARELGVDLAQMVGTNTAGRISVSDVKAHAKRLITSGPAAGGASPDADIEAKPLSNVRKIIAERLAHSWSTIPHVHHYDQADITQLEKMRRSYNQKLAGRRPKLTVTAVMIRVLAMLLKKYPEFNSRLDLDNKQLLLMKRVHIGIAVDSDRGLMVPVIRDVTEKSILEIVDELDDLAQRTRTGKIKPDELKGGTFTLSNLGGIGGVAFNPIINPPEVAILGVARSGRLPVFKPDGEVEARLMLPICLGYDHRVIDGAQGARFARDLAESMGNPLDLMLYLC